MGDPYRLLTSFGLDLTPLDHRSALIRKNHVADRALSTLLDCSEYVNITPALRCSTGGNGCSFRHFDAKEPFLQPWTLVGEDLRMNAKKSSSNSALKCSVNANSSMCMSSLRPCGVAATTTTKSTLELKCLRTIPSENAEKFLVANLQPPMKSAYAEEHIRWYRKEKEKEFKFGEGVTPLIPATPVTPAIYLERRRTLPVDFKRRYNVLFIALLPAIISTFFNYFLHLLLIDTI